MGDDVDDVAIVIAEEEPAHSPVLVRDRMNDLKPGRKNTFMDRVDFGRSRHANANGRVGGCLRVACHHLELNGGLVSGTEIPYPAEVHPDTEVEDLRVQLVGPRNISHGKVGNDPCNTHLLSVAAVIQDTAPTRCQCETRK